MLKCRTALSCLPGPTLIAADQRSSTELREGVGRTCMDPVLHVHERSSVIIDPAVGSMSISAGYGKHKLIGFAIGYFAIGYRLIIMGRKGLMTIVATSNECMNETPPFVLSELILKYTS